MEALIVLIVLCYAFGIYYILLSLFKIPKYSSEVNKIVSIFKKKKHNSTGDVYSPTTHKIAERLNLPSYLKIRLQEKLQIAEINSTPELYIANLINKSFTYILFAIIFIPFQKMLSIIFAFSAVLSIFKGYNSINDEIKIKTEKIEKEIPKFLDFMTNSFKFNKNVKQALESYEKIAGEYLKNNISITIADMATGNNVNALKRLDARINSYNFSKVIRAIIQVVKGDENTQYLVNLYRESANAEYERLKLEANKKLDKVSMYSKVLLICLITIIFSIMGLMFFKNFTQINGMY